MSCNTKSFVLHPPPKKRIRYQKRYENKSIKISDEHRDILPDSHPAKEYNDWKFYPLDPYHPDHSEYLREMLLKEGKIEKLEEEIKDLINKNKNLLKEYHIAKDKSYDWKSENELSE